jgi:trans-2,3-dihydro-3-hydroxyanthranilate isomerase
MRFSPAELDPGRGAGAERADPEQTEMSRRYAILDVFTDRPLAGNQLAVVLEADSLDDATMQAIAAEFNLAETVFVFPASKPPHSASVRIFTPASELPFAGHPTVGTAVLLALERASGGNDGEMVIVLEEKVGPVRCGVRLKPPHAGHAVFDLPRLPEEVGPPPPRDAIAAALGLAAGEIGFENHLPTVYTAGLAYVFVPVRDLAAIARARGNGPAWRAAFGSNAVYLYCRETLRSGRHFHARMFAPEIGIVEDPATGSAVAALAAVIARFDQPPGGEHRYLIEQGHEIGRPSLIGLEMDMDGGAVAAARIAGDVVVVARGTLEL